MATYNVTHRAIASTLRGEIVRVDILKKDAEKTTPVELLLAGDNPVVITWESDDIFKPLKMSGATVKTLMENPDLSLFTGGLNDVVCKIYRTQFTDEQRTTILSTYGDNPTNEEIMSVVTDWGDILWYGFLTPNVYSQNYDDVYDELDLEFVDILSNMENTKFERNTDGFWQSFHDYFQKAIESVDAAEVIDRDVFVMCEDEEMVADIVTVGCMERNFIDETDDDKDGAMTWQEVVESIMMYLNRSICYYGDQLRIYDPLESDDVEDLSSIGIAENKAQISLGDVYNKVTVVENTNPEDSLFEEDIFDTDEYVKLTDTQVPWESGWSSQYQIYIHNNTVSGTEYTRLFSYFSLENDACWKISGINKIVGETTSGSTYTNYSGSFVYWGASYKNADGVPSSIDWNKSIAMRCAGHSDNQITESLEYCHIIYKGNGDVVVKGGYFVLSMSYFYSTVGKFANSNAEDPNKGKTVKDMFIDASLGDTVDDIWIVELKVGDKYFDGTSWTTEKKNFEVKHQWSAGDTLVDTEVSLDNSVTWMMSLNNTEEGVAIPLPDGEALFGKIQVTINASPFLGMVYSREEGEQGEEDYVEAVEYVHISDLSLAWRTVSDKGVTDESDEDEDITFAGYINEDNITEYDDIEFKVNTYNTLQPSYSYAISCVNSEYDFPVPTPIPEETCITRYVGYYSEPRLVYSNTLKDIYGQHIMPWQMINIDDFGKTFVTDGLTLNLLDNSADVTLKEIPN